MSKVTHAEALIALNEYHGKIIKLLPETKNRNKAIDLIHAKWRNKDKLDLMDLNYYRLIKHYRAELNGKLGPDTIHSLFSIAVFLLGTPEINNDVLKAIKRARILYDRHDRKLGVVLHELI